MARGKERAKLLFKRMGADPTRPKTKTTSAC
jgi:hypothetical protein